MDAPAESSKHAESSEHAEHPHTDRHAAFDLADSLSRVPLEKGTDKEEPYEGETKIHLSENLDGQKSGIKRSSTYPFSSPKGRNATTEHVKFKTPPLQDGHKRDEMRAQRKSKIFAYRPPAGRIKMDSSPLPRSYHKGNARISPRIAEPSSFSRRPKYRRTQPIDDASIEDTDSDILSADEDSASDAMASSSLDFDFSSFASGPETQDEAETVPKVPEAPTPKKPSIKESEM